MASFNLVALIKLNCVGMILICMVVANAPAAEGTITCGQVVSRVSGCLGYLRGPGGVVPAACCNSLRALYDAVKATPDRQQACKCLKSLLTGLPGINYGLIEGVPAKCGLKFPFKVSISTDCNKVY